MDYSDEALSSLCLNCCGQLLTFNTFGLQHPWLLLWMMVPFAFALWGGVVPFEECADPSWDVHSWSVVTELGPSKLPFNWHSRRWLDVPWWLLGYESHVTGSTPTLNPLNSRPWASSTAADDTTTFTWPSLLLLLPPPITFFFTMSKILILLSEWHWLLASSHMLRLLITRNPQLKTLQPKKKVRYSIKKRTLLYPSIEAPWNPCPGTLKWAFSTPSWKHPPTPIPSKISSTMKTDTCLRQLIIPTHPPTWR